MHYLGKVINEMQYDMVYHEHLYYYSLLSAMKHFERYNMTVFDVEARFTRVPCDFMCAEKAAVMRKRPSEYAPCAKQEIAQGFDRQETYVCFAFEVAAKKKELMLLLNRLRRQGKRVAGYGASGRANTIIQYCEIDHSYLEYMIDDAPAKEGYYTPGSHILIRSSRG